MPRSLCLIIITLIAGPIPAQEEQVFRTASLPPEARRAIEEGLDYLAERQTEHGSIGSEHVVASTSLAGLAFLGSGSQYNRGRYGSQVRKCVRFVVESWQPSGAFDRPGKGDPRGWMHSQGYALLFLAEAYGMIPPEDQAQLGLKEKMQRSIRLVVDAQTAHGGWGYYARSHPEFGADESSTTVCQIQALRACRNAGLSVNREAIDRAVEYVRKCCKEDGSFRYSIQMGEPRSSYELTAAAVSTLNASGVYASEELEKGLEYLEEALRKAKKPANAAQNFYYYGNFYAAQALHQAGGDLWSRYFPQIRANLVEKQRGDGSWENPRGVAYATAMAILILEVPLQYLPIFQR